MLYLNIKVITLCNKAGKDPIPCSNLIKSMEEVVSYLHKSLVQYFATVGLDGKPKVRPFHFMFEEDGKLWFCTSNTKEVYKELQKHPYTELSTMAAKMSWIRLEGKVVFS